ncbi:MAG: isocitrate lyase/PEP mutase family protein [Ilumatobacteraceae bacterium]
MTHAASLRAGLAAGGSVLMPGVWDPLSALLAAQAGFDTVFLSGFALSGTLLGEPDIGIIGQAEMADAARRVCAAVPEVRVVVDADTGYGDDSDIVRTVELWEQAGAAGMFLEDQEWPKRCGHMEDKRVVGRDEWLSRLRTVLRARTDLHLTARTDSLAVVSLDEAIERAKMARDLGVDAVFVEAPRSVADLERIASEVTGTVLVANMVEKGKTPLLTPAELAGLGFRLVVSPLSGLLSAARALGDAYAHLRREGTMRDVLGSMTTFDGFTELVGLQKHLADGTDGR